MTTSVASAPGLSQSASGSAPPSFPDGTGGAVPAPSRRGTRHPILFLIDTSGSTGFDFQANGPGPDADIHRIHKVVQSTFRNLRYPTAGTDLETEQENIDVSLITYNDGYKVHVPWTMATNIDANIPPFDADGGTRTGAALQYALGYIGHRLRYYNSSNLKHGRPIILHYTDGAPTDMQPGDPTWQAVQARLHRLNPDPERRFATVRHLIAANGMAADKLQQHLGWATSDNGIELLSKLSGLKSTLALDNHPDVVGDMVEFITAFIEGVTQIFGAHEPDHDEVTDNALANSTHIKPAK